MTSLVRFSPDLHHWLVQNLDQGQAPSALVQIMIEQRMESRVAQAIVEAFVAARLQGRAPPLDSLEIEDAPPAYVYEKPIFSAESRIATTDRVVPVLLRVEQPVVVVLGDVLSADECQELMKLARPRLKPSTLVSPYSGENLVTSQRTSLGMFFRLREDAFIERLDARISELMNLPIENGEGFQVLHYPAGAEAAPHFDFLQATNDANRASIARSGQRTSTLITYLNDVESGGETAFPKVGLSVAPQRGNAVYFEYCNGQSQVDHASLHAGKVVRSGEKWVATKWMRQHRFVSANEAGSEGMVASNG